MGSQKPFSRKGANAQTEKRNNAQMEKYKADGNYTIYQSKDYPNGAFYAIEKRHNPVPHEIRLAEIVARNGLCMSLDAEGQVKIFDNTGNRLQAVSLDGKLMNLTQEIMALNGKPDVGKVADAIAHSFKKNKVSVAQSHVAFSFTPTGSEYHTHHITSGVKEFVRRVNSRETKAKPLAYIHVDEASQKMYLYKKKGKTYLAPIGLSMAPKEVH